MAINVNVSKLDELILLIINSVDEKEKRILLGKATEVYGRGGASHIKKLTGANLGTSEGIYTVISRLSAKGTDGVMEHRDFRNSY